MQLVKSNSFRRLLLTVKVFKFEQSNKLSFSKLILPQTKLVREEQYDRSISTAPKFVILISVRLLQFLRFKVRAYPPTSVPDNLLNLIQFSAFRFVI
ncbi:hypothetical protein D3C87_1872350 [compost metagenome]